MLSCRRSPRVPWLLLSLPAGSLCAHARRAAAPTRAAARACASRAPVATVSLQRARDTRALGARLAQIAGAGDVVLLTGEYGAGKTCLAGGFVRGWFGDPPGLIVTSPSYLIDNVYADEGGPGRVTGVAVHHMDLWRLPEGKISELVDLPAVFARDVSLIECAHRRLPLRSARLPGHISAISRPHLGRWPERLGTELTPRSRLLIELRHVAQPQAAADRSERGGDGGAGRADDDGDDDDDGFDDAPRTATLTAYGAAWEERLPALVAGFESDARPN